MREKKVAASYFINLKNEGLKKGGNKYTHDCTKRGKNGTRAYASFLTMMILNVRLLKQMIEKVKRGKSIFQAKKKLSRSSHHNKNIC